MTTEHKPQMDRTAEATLRVAWCERWLDDGHNRITPEWRNLLEDTRWLLEHHPRYENAFEGIREFPVVIEEAGRLIEMGSAALVVPMLRDWYELLNLPGETITAHQLSEAIRG